MADQTSEELKVQQDACPVKPGQRFSHYTNGDLYEVVAVGYLESRPRVGLHVVYRSLATGVCWIRPIDEFTGRVTVNVPTQSGEPLHCTTMTARFTRTED